MRTRLVLLTVGLSALSAIPRADAQQDNWSVVLNGRAIHVNAAREWNEENWGLGFEKEFGSTQRWVKVALGNGFKDSLGQPSYMAGGGIKRRFRLGSGADNWYMDLGVVGFLMTRNDVDGGEPFPGLLPSLTLGARHVALNFTYLPQTAVDRVTNAHLSDPDMDGVFFIQLKLDAKLFGFGTRRRPILASATQE
jgi:hypothetical protein